MHIRSLMRALPSLVGLAVAVTLYAIGGGRHSLPLDLCVVSTVGLLAYTTTLQQVQRRNPDPDSEGHPKNN
ncbi:hypothetical protein ACFV90_40755 [Streptomyces sp. NPDC059904]|uniref:hypothetical protein n=1 Tax=Streptomyces sp. NPDC059904 TaxID=3346996 RepID=UPI003646EEB1